MTRVLLAGAAYWTRTEAEQKDPTNGLKMMI